MSTTKKKAPAKHGSKKSEPAAGAKKPWEQEPPKTSAKHTTLSPSAKAAAKRSAKKAGRPYPNLVDNMHAASESKKS